MPESLLKRIKRTTRLPSPPGTAMQILELCQREDADIGELATVLAADPALSLRLLKYANSPLVGASHEVSSVRQAVVMLGTRSVRLMALSFSLIGTNDRRACRGFDYSQFWSHSAACAVAARQLARQIAQLSPEDAFVAGLLAYIGKLVFATCLPEKYAAVLAAAKGKLGETSPHEPSHMGSTHEALGAEVLLDWGLPKQLAAAIRAQACPDSVADQPATRKLASVIGVATAIADILSNNIEEETVPTRWDALVASPLFDSREKAEEAVGSIREEFSELASMLCLSEGASARAEELQAEAGEVLGELSLAAQLKSEAVEKENIGLQEKAFTDGLTGLNNRAAFDQRLDELWEHSARNRRSLGLIMLDVDHFKKFNDSFGHQTGDAVLQAVGACLPTCVRSVDFPARYGGEEFAIIAPNVDRLTAAQICVKVRKAIETMVVEFGGQQHSVTVSVGAAILPAPAAPFTPEKLIEEADQQLYRSKQKGRNCCSMRQLQPTAAPEPTPEPAPV